MFSLCWSAGTDMQKHTSGFWLPPKESCHLKADIFPIGLAAAQLISAQCDGTVVKKIYCNLSFPLPAITFFSPSLIGSENCMHGCEIRHKERGWACQSVREKGLKNKSGNNGEGTEWKRGKKCYGQKAVVCSHHSSPRTMFYKTNEPWLL